MKSKLQLNSDAIKVRRLLNEDTLSPIDIFAIINSNQNYTLVYYPISDRISGMCIKDGESNIIAINSNMSYGRQRFTLAHELYHLLIEKNLSGVICEKKINGTKPDNEKEADIFASYLLAPYEALELYVEKNHKAGAKWHIDEIIHMEQFFQVSHQAILMRLKLDGYISDITEYQVNVIERAKKLGYDNKLYLPSGNGRKYFTTGEYIKKVELLKEKELISDGKYEEYMLDGFRSDIVFGDDEEGSNLND